MITNRKYTYDDFQVVRDFFVESYKIFESPVNWQIDRFNFTYAFSTAMRDKTRKSWEEMIHLWFDDDKLIGVVNSEGEDEGEAFIQVLDFEIEQAVLEEMFDFVESNLVVESEGMKMAKLRVPTEFSRATNEARFRGYKEQNWDEVNLCIDLNRGFEVVLPDAFELVSGDALSPIEKGSVHARAFEYTDKLDLVQRVPIGFAIMAELSDYKSELEVYCLNHKKEAVAFCNLWFDSENKVATLEPVGCAPTYRKNGLGKACVYEGLNRVKALGATKVYVGSSQEFYKNIGFVETNRANVLQVIV